MKLSEWAEKTGIHYNTAYRWFVQDKMPCRTEKTPSGSIIVYETAIVNKTPKTCVYARVSSSNKRDDLARQAQRCHDFCAANGWTVEGSYSEVASGMNDNRKIFWKMMDSSPSRIVIEHKDRLTRFGFTYIERLCRSLGIEIVVINRSVEEQDDLMKDMIAIITSFCCRLYGARRGAHKSTKIKTVLNSMDE